MEENNKIAIVGFICSLCGSATLGLSCIVGLILSIIGLKRSKKANGSNKVFAILGIVFSIIYLLFIIAFISFFIFALGSEINWGEDLSKNLKLVESKKIIEEYDGNKTGYIEGKLKNIKDEDYQFVNISFFTYDEEGNVTGTCTTYIDAINKKQTWKFKAICDSNDIDTFKLKEISADID